jgi:hypothetical protein
MTRSILTAASLIVLQLACWPAAAAQQYSCRGQMIGPNAQSQTPLALDLNLGPPLALKMGDGTSLATTIVSNNKIQLKFRTKAFVGEFFHYTGDLILIYKSGHLGRLTCS